MESSYAGYTFPAFDDFTVTERFDSTSSLRSQALGDKLLRADFTADGKAGEGMFAASVVDFGSFAISAVTAAKDTFIEWESLLTQCMKTLEYSDSFVSATNQSSNEQVALARQISENFNAAMDGIMDSWESRSRSQDIMSQKQSDATLGYERVYDTETGEVYRATNGFTDVYDGKRYETLTDEQMYAEPISGYIERVD